MFEITVFPFLIDSVQQIARCYRKEVCAVWTKLEASLLHTNKISTKLQAAAYALSDCYKIKIVRKNRSIFLMKKV